MFWFVVFLLMVGAAFYMYQRLKTIESEIRDEQFGEQGAVTPSKEDPPKPAVAEARKDQAPQEAEPAPETEDDEIVALVRRSPGMKQTELYGQLPGQSPKQLQQVLRKMAEDGVIRREKVGSSYRLYVD